MRVVHGVSELQEWRRSQLGRSVGFVPTMGALHAGHASLVKRSIAENSATAVSIFVNPSQFAPGEDLDEYPRTLEADCALLESLGVDLVFAPKTSEMYPQGIPLDTREQRGAFVTVLGVSEMLEGRTRPNFFRGVATVVTKLLNIVGPDVAYFGQKDVQQFIVLQTMVRELFTPTVLVMMPIVRDASGLALSSRNRYLSPESLEIAASLHRGLLVGADLLTSKTPRPHHDEITAAIRALWQPFVDSGDFEVDYVSVARWGSLAELDSEEAHKQDTGDNTRVVISCAVYVRDRSLAATRVRLIDNVIVSATA
ncbi:pantoate--beta-alanine ligase PAN6 KNAG_0L02090 [Huiozyma naganishii CBS 8797]|uniref:Pantoate--beta-alanine ligase n=1 Tax=Huiozyma naganishii (strain ATCC MYA-139 / BCRC 22969 / CBS 8797 / KCTC 17520 / NBRC 10181 / NCYC 3082 / Yp74L-3) TaxID=1071383 RepID=J7S3U5_HUIN7|nr:hypothetical protein KNAG_0L02090 [Kazachstania naganishii CBS 8797]CCK72827.1 hypothetical protein KNAG_0L02090 [Kazachstania naganishii CBS 8797]